MDADKVLRFEVEGHEVVCHVNGGDRFWVCNCEHFQRTLVQHQEGFCPHTAVAIMRALDEGAINVRIKPTKAPAGRPT